MHWTTLATTPTTNKHATIHQECLERLAMRVDARSRGWYTKDAETQIVEDEASCIVTERARKMPPGTLEHSTFAMNEHSHNPT